MSTYFSCNLGQFLMAVSFVIARILRANKSDETWCELNDYLIMVDIMNSQ